MRPFRVVADSPCFAHGAHLGEGGKDPCSEDFLSEAVIEALDVVILVGLPGLDVGEHNAVGLAPRAQGVRDGLRAVVHTERGWPAIQTGGILDGIPTTRSTDGDWHLPAEDVVPSTWFAVDIAKDAHTVLIESAGTRRSLRVENALESMDRLVAHQRALPQPVRIAFELTGVYHRPLAYRWYQPVSTSVWSRRSRAPDTAKPATRRGTRMTRKTRASFLR